MVRPNVLPMLALVVLVLKGVLLNQVFSIFIRGMKQICVSPTGGALVEFNYPSLLWDRWPKFNTANQLIRKASEENVKHDDWMETFLREQWTWGHLQVNNLTEDTHFYLGPTNTSQFMALLTQEQQRLFSADASVTVRQVPQLWFKGVFKLEKEFTLDLNNISSFAFRSLATKVSTVMNNIYSQKFGSYFNHTEVKAFRKGSVIVELFLVFNDMESFPDRDRLTNIILLEAKSANTSDLNELSLNSGSVHITSITTLPETMESTEIRSSEVCGRPPLNNRIVGGQGSSPGNWPWQASLQYSGYSFCGGSLINKEWVLTAAHCSEGYDTSKLSVVLGLHYWDINNSTAVRKPVNQIIKHPGYNSVGVDNDIALIHLSSPVTFNDYILPVCLPESNSVFHNGTNSWVTGWGDIAEGEYLPHPDRLQEVEMPVIGNRKCKCIYGVNVITDNMICAGVLSGGKDSCQGDSGGPMVIQQNSVWIQSGVVSFGYGCARPSYPGVYSRVSQYQAWIQSHINSDQPGFVQVSSVGVDADDSVSCPWLPPLDANSNIAPTSTHSETADLEAPNFLVPTYSKRASADVCGRPPLTDRIVGGQDSLPGHWPWQASLQISGDHFCGGSLINKKWVLTSAHCFLGLSLSKLSVVLGLQDLAIHNPKRVRRGVRKVIKHPGFKSSGFHDDIALLRLGSPVPFSDYIRPVCLPSSESVFPKGTESWVTGWGQISERESLPNPGILQEVEVPVVGNRQCQCVYGDDLVTDKMICAGVKEGGKDACQGDSGGPMVSQQDSVWIQSGIVSFGYGCARPNYPGVYTRVSEYQAWIQSHIRRDRPGFIRFSSNGTEVDSDSGLCS